MLRNGDEMDGIINVYKEKGFTSHDVVAKLRGILHQRKIGHTGTLDPDATGVLPVCLGKATKVCELLTNKNKQYRATVKLGIITDTQDITGTILEEKTANISKEELIQTASSFMGEISQLPPMYSAIKVNGKRLYELARQGIEVERKPRNITVYAIDILDFEEKEQTFTMEVTCSKGTYIRTLCHDIGLQLGCGATMTSLVRTKVEPFEIQNALTLSQIEEIYKADQIDSILEPVDKIFKDYMKIVVKENGLKRLINGNKIPLESCRYSEVCDKQFVRVYDEKERFYAIYQMEEAENCFSVKKMFFNHVNERGE